MDYEKLTNIYNNIGGLKDLIFSKYFVKYYGFDDLYDNDYN